MTLRRLPLGRGHTENVDEYLRAWTELAKPLCDATGWKISAFDPGYTFSVDDRYFSIGDTEVKTLVDALARTKS